jgi:hypothetical protein
MSFLLHAGESLRVPIPEAPVRFSHARSPIHALLHGPSSLHTSTDHVSIGLVVTSGAVNPVDMLSIPCREAFQLAVSLDGCYVPPVKEEFLYRPNSGH